jgi:hypothetical protein
MGFEENSVSISGSLWKMRQVSFPKTEALSQYDTRDWLCALLVLFRAEKQWTCSSIHSERHGTTQQLLQFECVMSPTDSFFEKLASSWWHNLGGCGNCEKWDLGRGRKSLGGESQSLLTLIPVCYKMNGSPPSQTPAAMTVYPSTWG